MRDTENFGVAVVEREPAATPTAPVGYGCQLTTVPMAQRCTPDCGCKVHKGMPTKEQRVVIKLCDDWLKEAGLPTYSELLGAA